MIPAPTNYETIIGYESHWFETRMKIGTGSSQVIYTNEDIKSLKIERNVFAEDTMGVGGAVAAEITTSFLIPNDDEEKPNFGKMAKIVVETRACGVNESGVEEQSGWMQTGIYYTDTKKYTRNDDGLDTMEITGYDAMMKAEKRYTSESSVKNPLPIVQRCCALMGNIEIESTTQTKLTNKSSYEYTDLSKNYSVREVLKIIAASLAGNFIINYEGKLKLITLA